MGRVPCPRARVPIARVLGAKVRISMSRPRLWACMVKVLGARVLMGRILGTTVRIPMVRVPWPKVRVPIGRALGAG